MFVQWSRYGDFTDTSVKDEWNNIVCKTTYQPMTYKPIITQIGVNFRIGPYCTGPIVKLTFSPHYKSELIDICQTLQIEVTHLDLAYFQLTDYYIEFEALPRLFTYQVDFLNTRLNITSLVQLLSYFNQKFSDKNEPQPFSMELIQELVTMSKMQGLQDVHQFKHLVLPSNEVLDVKDSNEIQRLFADRPLSMEHRTALLKRSNSKQFQLGILNAALNWAVKKQPTLRAVELLLWYGANPFARPSLRGLRIGMGDAEVTFSAYETAISYGQYDKLELIHREFSKLSTSKPRLTIKHLCEPRVQYQNQQVLAAFEIRVQKKKEEPTYSSVNTVSVSTRLTPVSLLTPKEKSVIKELFKTTFASTINDKQLEQEFEKEFSGNRLIDLIEVNEGIIGFVLLDLIKPNSQKFPNHLFIYCAYSALETEYQNLGMMKILSFRLAYALKHLYQGLHIGLFYSAIHYNSYRLVKFEHFPKYQTPYTTSLIENLLDRIMPPGYRYVHNNLITYVEEHVAVVDSTNKKELTLDERMFQEELLGQASSTKEQNNVRSVPVLFLINAENKQFMIEHGQSLDLDFQRHIGIYAQALAEFIKVHKIQINQSKYQPGLFKSSTDYVDLDRCVNDLRPKL